MNFDVYFPFKNKEGKLCPGIKPKSMSWAEICTLAKSEAVVKQIDAIRAADEDKQGELKKELPAICYVGTSNSTRKASAMTPTQLVMIDIDHCEDAAASWDSIKEEIMAKGISLARFIMAAHMTPRKGLRIIFVSQPKFKTLKENMDWFNKEFDLGRFGRFDAPCKDFSRISFIFRGDELLYESPAICMNLPLEQYLVNDYVETQDNSQKPQAQTPTLFKGDSPQDVFTEDEIKEFDTFEFRGTPISVIVAKWVSVKGEPGKGEIHNYYNDMVKNFRNIVSNNKRALLYLLPRFGHTWDECWSSIVSICRVNTLSRLPKEFYFFLKDNGFYSDANAPKGKLQEYMLSEQEPEQIEDMPWLPPVFREFVKIAPKDFRVSMINALLPVMGTLTSYLQAKYYFDGRMHTTSFFSIIYAPPGTGKGFCERIMNILFDDLKIRDYVQQARENIYLRQMNKKSQNDKSPDMPKTSLRIIPPKNSESEFLQKQKDNEGYHMFTFAAEMDSWAKGVRAAGGNKDDMIRIAWDNGEYGQAFKSVSTFKGTVNLYWNVLITGTIQQLLSYFKNVENGLVTRCSFTSIENQEFAETPIWKELSKKDLQVLKKFTKRCDANTYTEPCNLIPEEVDTVSDDKFDNEVPWRFQFRPRQTVDMEWLRKPVEKFLESQRVKAALDLDKARDVFRRRAAVRGFRLGIMCHALWDKPRKSDLEKCIPFIEWWMNNDLEYSLKLWGTRYNNECEEMPNLSQRSLYNELDDKFSTNDVYAQCLKQNIKTPVRMVIFQWKKLGYVKKLSKNEFEKIKRKSL